ncbi:MAG TPA: rhodanese-like domain-containing protein [Herpetosiphonaceae bacterium]|nr:rhodanese-like domain-containing protein [Herpetosiphonaceae bacterium]
MGKTRILAGLMVVALIVGWRARTGAAGAWGRAGLAGVAGAAPAARATLPAREARLANPAIDMDGYLTIAAEAAESRERHRLTEAEFIRMAAGPGVIILDARSKQKYDELHIKGAINLSFPDITVASLEQTIPDRSTRILIYCNNNFINAEPAFPTKMATASLNISTYISLYTYGYRNIYELGPLLDIADSRLVFESSPAGAE